ncbi:MAG: ABC transporter substrate-binding protein [Chloroflexota bacterium]
MPGDTQASRTKDKVQLVYQDWRTDWFPPMARGMLDEFHATHPNIRVFYVPDPENLEEKMLADMQSGAAPDVFQGCCAHFPIWAQKGYTLDLRPYVNADLDRATIEDWDPAQYRSFFTRDGRQYGLPKYHGALALYFNKDLFDQQNLPYPDGTWTYDDYLIAMRRLTSYRRLDGRPERWGSMFDVSWDRVQVHVNGFGGRFVDPANPRHCLMGEPAALAAAEWLRARLWDDKVMATIVDVQRVGTSRAFSGERVAMVEDGSWALKDILAHAEFRVGVAPFPIGPDRRVTLATTDGFGIFAGTKYPDAAWELVKFLIGKEYGRAMAKANFLQPARASLVDEWVGFVREEFPERAKDTDIAAFADGQVKGYSVTAEVFANMADAREITYAAWEKVFTLGLDSVDTIVDACRQIEAAQDNASVGAEPCCA